MIRRFLFLTGCIFQEIFVDILGTIKKRYFGNAKKMAKSELVQQYTDYNCKKLTSLSNSSNGFILIDCFAVPQWVMPNSILVDYLREATGATVASYSTNGRNAYDDKLYSSFGAEMNFTLKLNKKQKSERRLQFMKALKQIKTKRDLFELEIDGVSFGIEIYETILRIGSGTVNVSSLNSSCQIFSALRYFIFFKEMMDQQKIKAVVLSHDVYNHMGILSKLANHYQIPVFHANPFEITRTDRPHSIYEFFKRYPEYFMTLSEEERKNGYEIAESALTKRIKGVVGVNMAYQLESAFEANRLPRQTSESKKIKICVATHCFFDNPHSYGGLLFIDFYEWLLFLGEISKKTEYEWYLKPHRDYLPGTLEILEEMVKKYQLFKLIDPNTTFHQLKDEGVTIALTCYGSIGHELPLLGYHVINAGYNPHIAYDFNIHCKTQEEYSKVLLNLSILPPVKDVDRIPEFFYVHSYLMHPDDYFFDSYKDFANSVNNDLLSDKCYEYFLADADKHVRKYRDNIDQLLKTNYRYSSELAILSRAENKEFKPMELKFNTNKN